MVVITAGGHEQRARVAPHHGVEAERVVVETGRTHEVADVEVNVAHPGAGGHSAPPLSLHARNQARHIERQRCHAELTVRGLPRVTRTIGVDFDAEAVGVVQVERLAHEMICRAGTRANFGEVCHEAAERGPIGKEDREVIEPEPTLRRDTMRAVLLMQAQQRDRAAGRAKMGVTAAM